MGTSSTCCSDNRPTGSTFETIISPNEVSKSSKIQHNPSQDQFIKQMVSATVPTLSPQIAKIRAEKRPFATELNKIKQVAHRKYGNDVYVGDLGGSLYPNGYGEMYKPDGSYFAGKFVNGKADGPGFFTNTEGLVYEGTMKDNAAVEGTLAAPKLVYKGSFIDNQFHGHGKQETPDGKFEGTYEKGKKKNGTLTWVKDAFKYEYNGDFNDHGDFEGKGHLTDAKGTYKGGFVKGQKHGKGVYEFTNGFKYEGEYKQGIKSGKGKLINKNNTISYEGEFLNGLPHGKGKAYSLAGEAYEADWDQGIVKS